MWKDKTGSKISGGASAVKEPGHFEVRKSSSQVTRKNIYNLFLVVALKIEAANAVSPSK